MTKIDGHPGKLGAGSCLVELVPEAYACLVAQGAVAALPIVIVFDVVEEVSHLLNAVRVAYSRICTDGNQAPVYIGSELLRLTQGFDVMPAIVESAFDQWKSLTSRLS